MPDSPASGIRLELIFSGMAAEKGEIPVEDLAQSLTGWNELFRLAYFASERLQLSAPRRDQEVGASIYLLGVRRGSTIVDLLLDAGKNLGYNLLAAALYERYRGQVIGAFKTAKAFLGSYLQSKRSGEDVDAAISRLEETGRSLDIRTPVDRDDSEAVLDRLDSAASQATAPVGTAAAMSMLRMPGETLDLAFDETDRLLITRPFAEVQASEDEPIVEVDVSFIRINTKTGTGLMRFVRPQHESQVASQQFFRCADRSIRSRANPYTGALHFKHPLRVRAQLRAYDAHRRGHYWLILGTVTPRLEEGMLFKDGGRPRLKPDPSMKPKHKRKRRKT